MKRETKEWDGVCGGVLREALDADKRVPEIYRNVMKFMQYLFDNSR